MGEEEKKLKEIASKVKNCQKCSLFKTANLAVPGEGNPQSKIFFIGEAPGYYEDQQGRPFVGRAGKLLDKSLRDVGFSREEVFIGNVLKHRPPENRDPLPEEIQACSSWLDEQIDIINPKVIVTLGRFSMNKFLPEVFISQVHGQPRWVDFNERRYLVFPMYHPAAALRNGNILQSFKSDFEKLEQLLDNEEKKQEQELNTQQESEEKKEEEQLSLL